VKPLVLVRRLRVRLIDALLVVYAKPVILLVPVILHVNSTVLVVQPHSLIETLAVLHLLVLVLAWLANRNALWAEQLSIVTVLLLVALLVSLTLIVILAGRLMSAQAYTVMLPRDARHLMSVFLVWSHALMAFRVSDLRLIASCLPLALVAKSVVRMVVV
jgi:hypothetical protein